MKSEELQAETEEELLRLQEEFLRESRPAAARVVRIGRTKDNKEHADATNHAQAKQAAAPCCPGPRPPGIQGGLTTGMPGILGGIVERQPSQQPPQAPQEVLKEGQVSAFPQAVHRKQSKFSLGRRSGAPPGTLAPGNTTSGAPPDTTMAPGTTMLEAPPGTPAPGTTVSIPARGSKEGPGLSESRPAVPTEEDANTQRVLEMTSEQREEALSELKSRLSSSTIEYLKKRGARNLGDKGGSKGPACLGDKGGSKGPASLLRSESGPAVHEPHSRDQMQINNDSCEGGASRGFSPPGLQPVQESVVSQAGPHSAAARLRFGIGGTVVGWQRRDERLPAEQVLQRDCLRQDEGVAPEGYTLTELCAVARSRVMAQRVMALNLLGEVLRRARPQLVHLEDSGGVKVRPLGAVPGVEEGGDKDLSLQVDWSAVWDHAVHEVGVAVLLRSALDEDSSQVIVAAVVALLALVGLSGQEGLVLEVADELPALGWPQVYLGSVRRKDVRATWEDSKEALGAPDGEAPTPAVVAGLDPLAGLLDMQFLERCAFLLESGCYPSAVVPLLNLLQGVVMAGEDVAVKMAGCPGLLQSLDHLLKGTLQGLPEGEPHVGPLAMMLIRRICHTSQTAAKAMRSAGVLGTCQSVLLTGMQGMAAGVLLIPPMAGDEECMSDKRTPDLQTCLLLEALRTWRVVAAHGLYSMHMDDMYPCVCRHLDLAMKFSHLQRDTEGALMSCLLSAEVLLLVDVLIKQAVVAEEAAGKLASEGVATTDMAESTMLSPGCAAALVQEVLRSMTDEVAWQVESLLALEEREGLGLEELFCELPRIHHEVHPALALPPAVVALTTLSAAIRLLQTYYLSLSKAPTSMNHQLQRAVGQLHLSAFLQGASVTLISREDLALGLLGTHDGHIQDPDRAGKLLGHLGWRFLLTGMVVPSSSPPCLLAQGCVAGLLLAVMGLVHSMRGPGLEWCGWLAEALGRQLLSWSAEFKCPTVMWSWDLVYLQLRSLQVRGFVQAVTLWKAGPPVQGASQDATEPAGDSGGWSLQTSLQHVTRQTVSPEEVENVTFNALLAVPTLLPPGAELLALTSLQLLTGQPTLGRLVDRAVSAWRQLAGGEGELGGSAEPRTPTDLWSFSNGEGDVQHNGPLSMRTHQVVLPSGPAPSGAPATDVGTCRSEVLQLSGPPTCSCLAANAEGSSQTDSRKRPAGAYPVPQEPDKKLLARCLFQGYTVAWLSMVPHMDPPSTDKDASKPSSPDDHACQFTEDDPQLGQPPRKTVRFSDISTGPDSQTAKASGKGHWRSEKHLALQLPCSFLDHTSGSRLPLPRHWFITEILELPHVARGSRQARGQDATHASLPLVACVLTLLLGLELASPCFVQLISTKLKLQAALHLAYVYNTKELQAGKGSSGDDVGDSPAYLHPMTRWSLAALTCHYVLPHGALTLEPRWVTVSLAEQLCHHFIHSSYGDPLYGCHLALMLLPQTDSRIQLLVWSMLASEKALDLLPPVTACLGSREQYTQGHRHADVINAIVKSLADGDMDKALDKGVVTADIALGCVLQDLLLLPSTEERMQRLRRQHWLRTLALGKCDKLWARIKQVAGSFDLTMEQVASAVVQVCDGGDAEMMDRLRYVLHMLDLGR